MAGNVDIAEDARFKFQIIQPVLNHVAYTNNANQLAVANYRGLVAPHNWNHYRFASFKENK